MTVVSAGASAEQAGRAVVPAGSSAARLGALFGTDVALLTVEVHPDPRGRLSVVDLQTLPFTVRRVFTVSDVPPGARRGGHRHTRGVQALVCLAGRIDVELRRGAASLEVTLLPDGAGLEIAAGVWSQQHYVEDGSTLLVLASEPYDTGTYDPRP
jgi:hypothetical protein